MIDTIVLHYTATYVDQDIGVAEVDAMHRARGWASCGYHFVNRLDGRIEKGRPENVTGAHVRGNNKGKLGITCVGGLLRSSGGSVGIDTRTDAQINSLADLVADLIGRYPGARVTGHRDIVATQCPAYDAAAWWASVSGDGRKPPLPEPVKGTTRATTRRYLSRGARNAEVMALQRILTKAGLYKGALDMAFGPKTEEAVRLFQHRVGEVVDGKVGPVTWAALFTAEGIPA